MDVHKAKELSAEIERINQENEHLTLILQRLRRDYHHLEMQARSLEASIQAHPLCRKRKIRENENYRSGGEESTSAEEAEVAETHICKTAPPRKMICMRTDSISTTINDGCHWRKYGQKMTRNNAQPRSYYRCAMREGCRVKKQVQRCAHDSSVVTIIYEGDHNHPLTPLAFSIINSASHQLNPANAFIYSNNFSSPSSATLQPDTQHSASLNLYSSNKSASATPATIDLTTNDHFSITEGTKIDPEFTAAVAMAVAGSFFSHIKSSSPADSKLSLSPSLCTSP